MHVDQIDFFLFSFLGTMYMEIASLMKVGKLENYMPQVPNLSQVSLKNKSD